MQNLTIKITDISDGKQKAFRAVIVELGNSIVYGDTIAKIFKIIPEVIEAARKNNIGVFKKISRVDKILAGR